MFRRLGCTLGLVSALLLGANGGPVNAAAPVAVNPLFQPLLPHLHGMYIPVVLPSTVPGQHVAGAKLSASLDDRTAWGYLVNIGFTPHCGGVDACRYGSVTGGAEIDTPTIFDYPRAKQVHLKNGALALYFPYRCGASCGDSVLVFREEGFVYTVTIKAGSLHDVLAMANSATVAITP